MRRPHWIAAALCIVAIGLVGLVALAPGSGPAGVIADTTSPTASPSPAPAPAVTIAATPVLGQAGQSSSFVANVANPPSGATLTYQWTFGDGASGNSQTTTHVYNAGGTYIVQVIVFGAGSGPISAQTTYTVSQSLAISANGPYSGQVGQAVGFRASALAGVTLPADTVFSWDFGDGARTTGPTPAHVYATTGFYTVTLTAASASTGQSGTATTTATISAGPVPAQFSVSISGPTQAITGDQLSYQANVTSGTVPADVIYAWSFGDGTSTAVGQSVSHSYAASGTYTVTLTAASAGTPSNSAGTTLTVSVQSSTSSSSGTVTYQPGWNLLAGPTGTIFAGASNPLYSVQAGDTAYEQISAGNPVTSGRGYWAYFISQTTVTLASSGVSTASASAPAGQYVMIGNPSATQTLTIRGADIALAYDPVANAYQVVTTLKPGQAAFVVSIDGGTVTVGP